MKTVHKTTQGRGTALGCLHLLLTQVLGLEWGKSPRWLPGPHADAPTARERPWPLGHASHRVICHSFWRWESPGKSHSPGADRGRPARGVLARPGTNGHGGRRRARAHRLKYYPGVFNYLFLMDLQGLFHQARGGWVWGCGERAARAGAGKMAHISILKPFTIVSSMKDAANKTAPPAPASPSRKF